MAGESSMPAGNGPATPKAEGKGGGVLNLATEYGPILCFFLVYHWFSPDKKTDAMGEVVAVVNGTLGFVVAAIVAAGVSLWKVRRISPMLMLSTALVVFFGSLTVFLRDPFWIQVKPTAIYLFFGISLLVGVWRKRALLQYLLQSAFEGLDHAGWMILSRNWGLFFLFFAVLNEVLRRMLSPGEWIAAKLWLFMPLSFLFTFLHMPMLLRHGLGREAEGEVISQPPHE